jgi:hypothetical protein
MKVLRKAAATIGIGTAIVLAFAAPANAASASASSSYYKVSTLTCRSYVRVDDWTSGKIRVTATTACDKKALQINLKAIVMKSSKGPTMTSHYVHCPFTASCTSYAFVTNAAGRQTRCGVNSPMVNDSYLTRGAKVCLTA